MNIASLYSLTAGQSLNKPWVFEKFYPMPFSRWIVFQPFSKPSKNYGYWRQVLEILLPILHVHNIQCVQVGQAGEPPFNGCFHTQGQTNLGQLEFLISHAQLVLTTDSISSHLAGAYNKPLVNLISNNFKQCVESFWGDKSKQVVLEPDRTKKLPSFALDEGPNPQINEIKPEDIVRAVCKLLNLDFNFPYSTIHRGQKFNSNVVFETVPNQAIQLQSLGIDSILVRMDYLFNEQALIQQLQLSNVSIVTNKAFNKQILHQFKSKIRELIYFIDESHDVSFVEEARKLGINIILLSELPIEKLNPIKLSYMDIGVINHKPNLNKENFDFLRNKDLSKLQYQSNKFTLSAGKIFQSKAAWLNNQPLNQLKFEFQPVIDNIEFWNEMDSFWLTQDEKSV